jgi:uncharacterized membrane protein
MAYQAVSAAFRLSERNKTTMREVIREASQAPKPRDNEARNEVDKTRTPQSSVSIEDRR